MFFFFFFIPTALSLELQQRAFWTYIMIFFFFLSDSLVWLFFAVCVLLCLCFYELHLVCSLLRTKYIAPPAHNPYVILNRLVG